MHVWIEECGLRKTEIVLGGWYWKGFCRASAERVRRLIRLAGGIVALDHSSFFPPCIPICAQRLSILYQMTC